jgi:nitroreductase
MPFDILTNFGKGGNEKACREAEEPTTPNDYSTISFLIKRRRSVRKYLQKEVPWEVIERVLESTKYAPSAGNYQPWEFVVVRNEGTRKALIQCCFNQTWMAEAPVMIVACTNMRLAAAVFGERGAKLYGTQAVSAAIENMIITAESLDLATCWVGAFSEGMVSQILQCPEYARPCAIITMGYPCGETPAPPKQSIQEYVHLENFGNSLLDIQVAKEKSPTYVKVS